MLASFSHLRGFSASTNSIYKHDMGLSLSLLNKLGVPGVSSLTTDHFYEKFFNKDIKEFGQFHTAFIDLCKFINDVMPGKHFAAPTRDEIEGFYKDVWMKNSEPKRREELATFVKKKMKELKTDHDNVVIITGMVVPAAAVVLKNTAENIQPVKRFKLHLIPNFVFVPTCTFLALAGVQLMQIGKKSKS